jgi:hypothetical protein
VGKMIFPEHKVRPRAYHSTGVLRMKGYSTLGLRSRAAATGQVIAGKPTSTDLGAFPAGG